MAVGTPRAHITRLWRLMDITKRLLSTLERDEGKRALPYVDSVGLLTVGIGRNIQERGITLAELSYILDAPSVTAGVLLRTLLSSSVDMKEGGRILFRHDAPFLTLFPGGLSDEQCYTLLETDVKDCVKDAVAIFGAAFDTYDLPRQEVIVNLLFNLGLGTFKKFRRAITAIKAGDWDEAGVQILDSRAARQTGQRYHRLARVLSTGDPAGFEVD